MYIFLTVWQTDTASVLMEAIGYINFPDHRLLDSLTIAYVMQTLSGPPSVCVYRGHLTPEIKRRKQSLIFAVEGCAWCLFHAPPTSPMTMAFGLHLRDSISSVKVDSHHSGSQQDMMSSYICSHLLADLQLNHPIHPKHILLNSKNFGHHYCQ